MRKFKKGDIVIAKKETIGKYRFTSKENQFIGKVIKYNDFDELIIRTIHSNKNGEYGCIYEVEEDYFELVYSSTEKEEILDSTEKEYLRNVIKPFRDKVENIQKFKLCNKCFIRIELEDEYFNFPNLPNKNMYKNMELFKKYSLEDLGL